MSNNLNVNIPNIRAWVKRSWLTKNIDDKGLVEILLFGIQSYSGRILTFHGMTNTGVLRARVPLSEVYWKESESDIPFDHKQLWDCFGYDISVCAFDYLSNLRCQVMLKDRSKVWATYVLTVDWFDNPYSEEPRDYKCGHLLKADPGYFLLQPNNRIIWSDANWITGEQESPEQLKEYKVDDIFLSVETVSDRWVTENSDCFYYDTNNVTI